MIFGTQWKLIRTINDDLPIYGLVSVKQLTSNHFLWEEKIETITLDKQVIEGSQAYKLDLKGGILNIIFSQGLNKGNLFQRFNLRNLKESSHQCDADHYRSTLEINSKTEVQVTHNVRGPRKNYVMRTQYERLG